MTRAVPGRKRLRSDAVSRADVVRLRLLRMTAAEIAKELKRAQDTISSILQEPDVIAAVADAERDALEDAQAGLRTLTRRAMQRLGELVDSDDDRIALDAAKTVLTKAGADAPTKSESKNEHAGPNGGPVVVMTTEEARELARKGLPTT